MWWGVARVAGELIIVAGAWILWRSMRSLRMTMRALRLDCLRLSVEVHQWRRTVAGLDTEPVGELPAPEVEPR